MIDATTLYGIEVFDIADVPTKALPVLPRNARPGTAPMRLKAILNECQRTMTPVDPMTVVMHRLFMATMDYYHRHGHVAMSHALVATLDALRRTTYDDNAERRRSITVVAIDFISRSQAVIDPAVRLALQAADAIVTPTYSEVMR